MTFRLCLLISLIALPLSSLAGSITCRGPHYYPTNDELEFALAAASISDESTRARIIGESRLQLNTCASELRAKLCGDAMILALLDKRDSVKGGVAAGAWAAYRNDGNFFDKILTGGVIGGTVGASIATVEYAQCNKRLAEEISPIADRLTTISPGSRVDLHSFLEVIDRSASGRYATIRPDEARYLKDEIHKWISAFHR